MPDQLAHYLFARRVWAALGKDMQRRIDPSSMAFRAGSFGPDPLFNDLSAARRSQGFQLHRKSGAVAMERFREAVRNNLPSAVDYAAGFFTHYALDRLCHPYLKALDKQGKLRHIPLEVAYDRALKARGEAETHDLPRSIVLSYDACRTAVLPYEGVDVASFYRDVRAYWKLRLLLLEGGGKLSLLGNRLGPNWRGVLACDAPGEAMQAGIDRLDQLLSEAVQPAAEQLETCFEAIDRGAKLDQWLDADFSGFCPS